jgi:hypothetical protein
MKKSVYCTNSKNRSGANSTNSRNRQDRSEKNELDRSKTKRGSILKTFMEPRNRFQGIVAWGHICKCLRSPRIDSKKTIPLSILAWAHICKSLGSPGIDSKEPIPLANVSWARIGKHLRSPGIDSKELIPPANALAGLYNNPIPARFLAPLDCSKTFTNTGSGYIGWRNWLLGIDSWAP